MIMALLAGFLLLLGAFFVLLAAVGLFRLPDLYLRMQAATKASTFGVIAMMLAVAAHFGDAATSVEVALVIVFFLLTSPVAAHAIGRAAYLAGVELWKETRLDELRRDFDRGAGPECEGVPPRGSGK